MSFRITWKTHIKCFIIATVMILILREQVLNIIMNFITAYSMPLITGYFAADFYIYLLIIMLPVSIVHEFIHAAFYKLFGGKTRIGFKVIYFYTLETSGKPLRRNKFLIILLAPLVIISAASIFFGVIGSMFYLLNLTGSCGDIYMAFSLLKYRQGSMITDRSYGYDVS